MKLSKKPIKPAMLCLMALILPACQTTSNPSSSTIDRTATEIERDVREGLCSALRPTTVPRIDHDASPETMRNARAKDAAAWMSACLQNG
jgi:hypothetical protein